MQHYSKIAAGEAYDLCKKIVADIFLVTNHEQLVLFTEEWLERILPMDHAGLFLYDKEEKRLKLYMAHGFTEKERLKAEETAMERHPGHVFKTGQPLIQSNDDPAENRLISESERSFHLKSRLYQPIVVGEEIVGVMAAASVHENAFNEQAISFFSFFSETVGRAFLEINRTHQTLELNKEISLLSFLSGNSKDAIVVTDLDSKIIYVNQAFTDLSGYHLAEIKGRRPGDFLQGKATNAQVKQKIRNALKKKTFTQCEIVNYTKNGKEYIVDLSIYPYAESDGIFTKFISIQKDITEKYIIQQRIKEEKEKLQAILNAMPDTLYLIDLETEQPQNEAAIPADEMAGLTVISKRVLTELFQTNKDQISKAINATQRKISNNQSVIIENAPVAETDTIYEMRFSFYNKYYQLCLIRNITKEKKLEYENRSLIEFNLQVSGFYIDIIKSDPIFIDTILNDFMAYLGQHFLVDRAYYFHRNFNAETISNTIEWCSHGTEPQIEFLKDLPVDIFPWFWKNLLENQIINIPFVKELGLEAENEKALLEQQDIKSLIVVPVFQSADLIGFYGLDSVQKQRYWTNNEISKLRLAGDLFSSGLSLKKYHNEIKRFKSIFDHSDFGEILLNSEGLIIYDNDFLSIKYPELLKKHEKRKYISNYFADSKTNRLLSKKLHADKKEDFELNIQFTSKSGNISELLCKGILISEAPDTDIFSVTFVDITERSRNEKSLRKALKIISEQHKKVMNFSYVVSHNIRSHSSTINGFLGLLKNETDLNEIHSITAPLIKASENLERTLADLNELLNLSNKTTTNIQKVVLTECINTALIAMGKNSGGEEFLMSLNFPDDFFVMADNNYMNSIMLNLISNAFKYRKKDAKLVLKIDAKKTERKYTLSVSDNGIGIDLAMHGKKIFGIFQKFHGNPDARGIGLYITKSQVEAMGGTITVKSSPGKGSAFTIELPSKEKK